MRPKVGDTAVLHVKVVEVIGDKWFHFRLHHNRAYITSAHQSIIKEIIPQPIAVGDTVRVVDDILNHFYYTVLAIHGSDTPLIMPYGPTRRWAVIVHGDDIPVVIQVSKIECVV